METQATAPVDTQVNTNVSPEQDTQQSTEPEQEPILFNDSKDPKEDIDTDQKPEDPFIKLEDDKATPDEDPEPKAPEKYEPFSLELGKDIDYQISDEQFGEFSEFAKELGMTQEQAQKIVDFDIKRNIAREQQFIAEKEQVLKEDTETLRKEYGEKFDESKILFNKAVNAFMPNKLKRILVDAGFDRNPELFKMMVNIGKQIGEDTFVQGEKKVSPKNAGGVKSMFSDLNVNTS